MKNLKTTMLTAIFALCCYANVNAQTAPVQQNTRNKSSVIKVADTSPEPDEQEPKQAKKGGKSSVIIPNPPQVSVNRAKTPPPVQDWKKNRNIHQYPGGGHAVTDGKSGTIPVEEVVQPQQTAKGIKDNGVKSHTHQNGCCQYKIKAGGNPQTTAKEKADKE